MPEQLFVFSSPTCHPCHKLMEDLKKENIHFTEVDISKPDSQELVKKYYVCSAPTLVAIKNNKPNSKIGFQSIGDVKQFLDHC